MKILAFLVSVLFACSLSLGGCASDPSCAGGTCQCPAGEPCAHDCSGGGECRVQCAPGQSCDVTCEPGQICGVQCPTASSCNVACNGAAECNVMLPATTGRVTECTGGSCIVTCGGDATETMATYNGSTATCP